MQQGDHNSYYHFPNPSPNPTTPPSPAVGAPANLSSNTYASAPPFTDGYGTADYSNYPQNYGQNTDHPPASSYGSFDSTSPYPPYDQHQSSGYSHAPHPPPSSAAAPSPYSSSSLYSAPPSYEKPVNYGQSRSDNYGDGVYAYQGGKVEPYGSRGTLFDDYGRSISVSSGRDSSASSKSSKIVTAVPKADVQEDVQKFRVKLLAETYGQTTTDVLCQIGLDGLRMLDPSTSRTLRIYPLENITRCEKLDSSILAFWSKTSVDIDAKRIRLQSNSYTTNTLLDTVTAAMFQAKEIGGSSRPPTSVKLVEQSAEKKKGLGDWINIIKPVNEEKDHWVPDEAASKCTSCGSDFGAFMRRHHCRNCGDVFCDKCTQGRIALTADENAPQVRVCDRCMAEVSQRLSNAKESASRNVSVQSHEDLARKLQEEMQKNRKSSSGSREGSGRRMKDVACPTCTVYLEVQVPISGSETIECGVCQNPFLVSAH
ncbi:unnamed protein product [Brassica oleracea]